MNVRKSIILTVFICGILAVYSFYFYNIKYEKLEDLEKYLIDHNISYTSKPIESKYSLDIAKEQRVYEIKGKDIYVYIVNESEIDGADYRLSNEILGSDYVVATTNIFLFAYTDTDLEKFQKTLSSVIEEIRKSEKN